MANTKSILNHIVRVILLITSLVVADVAQAVQPGRLWFYATVNFQQNSETDGLIKLLNRAKKCGYNGAVINDYKFGNLTDRSQQYFENLKRAKQAADKVGIELIPCVMPVGYSSSVLQHNPNLAAGLPVRQTPMIVRDGVATTPGDNLLSGGQLDRGNSDQSEKSKPPQGWSYIDGWGKSTQYDKSIKHSGDASLKMTDFRKGHAKGNCRLMQTVSVRPYRQYQLVVWAKTDNARGGEIQAAVSHADRTLNYASLGVQRNQGWTRHAIVFNSLDAEQVNIALGIWGGESGTLWMDSVELREVAGVNLLRRKGCPAVVRESDSGRILNEGRDYQLWQDPKLGMVPSAGKYSDDHDGPPLRLTKESGIADGTRLDVSFYHTVLVHDHQVCGSLVHDELFKIMQQQVQTIQKYWQPTTFFLQHDEIRLSGHDELVQPGQTCGELLAANFSRCESIIHKLAPSAEVIAWSDMFDPHHNAVDNYYLSKSTLKQSWKGLSPKVTVANWNHHKSNKSLEWFAGRKHKQLIAGYYDKPVKENAVHWRQASENVDGVSGWIYATWTKNYDDLEAFAKATQF